MRPEFYGIVHRYRFLINPVNGSPMDTRLTDVEIRLTHQEAALEEMNHYKQVVEFILQRDKV